MTAFSKYLHEASLSRCYRQTKQYDSGLITASRKTIKDYKQDCKVIENITRKQNRKRNAKLSSDLLKKYSVTSVRGAYIENYKQNDAVEVGENSYFIVDIENRGNLRKDLMGFGEKWNQDSVVYIPMGGTSGQLIGTSLCNTYPNYKETIILSNPVFGKNGEFMTKVHGRPFILESFEIPVLEPEGWFGKYGKYIMTKDY